MLPDKPLPNDLESERRLLGAIISNPEIWPKVAVCVNGDFYASKHQQIFNAMKAIRAAGYEISADTIYNQLKNNGILDACGGSTYIAELLDTIPASWEFYKDRVVLFGTKRRMIESGAELIKNGYDELAPLPADRMPVSTEPKKLSQLFVDCPNLRPVIIDTLIREGESLNVISATKVGKSWMVLGMAFSIACGVPWFGMETAQGDVLILDNELHDETITDRARVVAEKRGIDKSIIGEHVYVESMRGRLQDVFTLENYFRGFKPGKFRIVILDALYRFIPQGFDENSNSDMTQIYNKIDSYANHLRCAFVLIHHSTKGNQSEKNVTDVGAGGGSQARATDSHLILRSHEEDDAVVMEVKSRSWGPRPAVSLKWQWPLWDLAPELDPAKLRKNSGRPLTHKCENIIINLVEGMTCTEWQKACAECGIARAVFYRLREQALKDKSIILVSGQYYKGPPVS